MTSPLDDPRRVDPRLKALVLAMLDDPGAAYASAARSAVEGLSSGTLVAMLSSRDRGRISSLLRGARPAEARGGALFQCVELASPPRSDDDLPGWILVADDYAGGALVLAHEIAHFRGRLAVHLEARRPDPELVDPAMGAGFHPDQVRWVRASFLNEVAARHTAYLAHERVDPTGRLPEPGALFACAVKIAQYPEVYNDCGAMARLVARGDDGLLRDQVGRWFPALTRFSFFDRGTPLERAHAEYLHREAQLALLGRGAPRVAAEGTL